jgi:hypothetical protein
MATGELNDTTISRKVVSLSVAASEAERNWRMGWATLSP